MQKLYILIEGQSISLFFCGLCFLQVVLRNLCLEGFHPFGFSIRGKRAEGTLEAKVRRCLDQRDPVPSSYSESHYDGEVDKKLKRKKRAPEKPVKKQEIRETSRTLWAPEQSNSNGDASMLPVGGNEGRQHSGLQRESPDG